MEYANSHVKSQLHTLIRKIIVVSIKHYAILCTCLISNIKYGGKQ